MNLNHKMFKNFMKNYFIYLLMIIFHFKNIFYIFLKGELCLLNCKDIDLVFKYNLSNVFYFHSNMK